MKVTILGCGTSAGVPMIGCRCPVCTSNNPKNRRQRCSILIEQDNQTLIVDTGPDFRNQCLDVGLQSIDAIFYTHAHADHVHGIDDVRSLNNLMGRPVKAYAHPEVFEKIIHRFDYAFSNSRGTEGFWRPQIERIDCEGPFDIGSINAIPVEQGHGRGRSFGLRIGDFAYSPDVDHFSEQSLTQLQGIKVWIVDALRDKPHPSHAHLDRTLEWIERIKPARAILTHMNHEVDYDDWTAKLRPNVEVAFDGMIVEI